MNELEQSYEPCRFEHKNLFEDSLQKYIFSLLENAYFDLMSDKKVNINKKDELKCTAQLVYFAIKLRNKNHYPFLFHPESPYEDMQEIVYGEVSPKTSSRIDIKIRKKDWDEESFITVECKRLDKDKYHVLIKKYVDEGMDRFISGKYCAENNCSFMVGFIVDGDNLEIISEINAYVQEKYSDYDKLKKIKENLHYFSKHNREKGFTPFKINHLFANIDKITI
ncbi:hypothetical protein BEH94_02945 [Candidatus Altiarchaeales archaeon WOR_SM1_SCG]|nr:hypothetical protein BEH94_02945 [Candidatus Altiarchaeales archaeon WOR_SM1_SCG]